MNSNLVAPISALTGLVGVTLLSTPEGREEASEAVRGLAHFGSHVGSSLFRAFNDIFVLNKSNEDLAISTADFTTKAISGDPLAYEATEVDSEATLVTEDYESEDWSMTKTLLWIGGAVVVAATSYYLLKGTSSSTSSARRPKARSRDPENNDTGNIDSSRLEEILLEFRQNETPRVPENKMKELINSHGREIYKKLLEKRDRADFQSRIWRSRDFRINIGQPLNGSKGRLKTWSLQVNKNPESQMAKQLLRRDRGRHEKLFWDAFDIENPPTFGDWANAVMGRFL